MIAQRAYLPSILFLRELCVAEIILIDTGAGKFQEVQLLAEKDDSYLCIYDLTSRNCHDPVMVPE